MYFQEAAKKLANNFLIKDLKKKTKIIKNPTLIVWKYPISS